MNNLLARVAGERKSFPRRDFSVHKAIIQKGNRGEGSPGEEGDVLKRAMSLGNVGQKQGKSLWVRELRSEVAVSGLLWLQEFSFFKVSRWDFLGEPVAQTPHF